MTNLTIVRISLGHGILGYQSCPLWLRLLLAKEHIVQIELPGVVRPAIVPLTATIVTRWAALALRHHRNTVLQSRGALLGGTPPCSPDAEAYVAGLVRIRPHLLTLCVELGAHSAASIALQTLRHALEVLVRCLPVAHLLRGLPRGLATAVISYGTASGVHENGFAAVHGQHALRLHTLLGATCYGKRKSNSGYQNYMFSPIQ